MIWDFWARYYNRLWVQKISLAPTRQAVVAALSPHLKLGFRILDVGCGTGQLAADLLATYPGLDLQIHGVDQSEAMVLRARAQVPGARFSQRDLSTFEEKEGYDLVLCTHALPYLGPLDQALTALARPLVPGGALLLSQASQNSLYDQLVLSFVKLTTGPARYHSLEQLKKASQARFRFLEVRRLPLPPPMPSVAFLLLEKKEATQ